MSESPTYSKGSDYIPSGDEDRVNDEEIDITIDLEEKESLRRLGQVSTYTTCMGVGFLHAQIP